MESVASCFSFGCCLFFIIYLFCANVSVCCENAVSLRRFVRLYIYITYIICVSLDGHLPSGAFGLGAEDSSAFGMRLPDTG